ncbi:hypothetical protein BD324DRAFT_588688 [Kockovaella imperatae]|uniref:Single hybrid motif-containing protein n=1 Tax=Kockovaella imperatae TaxID=4999 RepID=A0A1Y1ULD0_9TREE|nr:hypothetical protein BD324DRAFT_588688 [Kockovaella imperatae]ORX38357.1 hypothetical protein BD324DRAFT_588688 [Kockovaella imperatae]
MASSMLGMSIMRSVRASSSKCSRQVRYATTAMRMPAMSPTMTEGGITSWKKEEGETFAAGDVLLEVETDKATIDVEAQDDGVMGKILVQAGSNKIPVGQIIAMLAEEGDDLSSIKVPSELGPDSGSSKAEGSSSGPKQDSKASKPEQNKAEGGKKEAAPQKTQDSTNKHSDGHKTIQHSKPLFPSVMRLLQESSLSPSEISKLKGTGKNGMLTKGDVLLALGKIKSAFGSAEKLSTDIMGPSGKRKSEAGSSSTTAAKKEEPLDGPSLRRLIVAGMSKATLPAKAIDQHVSTNLPLSLDAEFDALLAPYHSLLPPPQPQIPIPSREQLVDVQSIGQSSKRDEWAGLM